MVIAWRTCAMLIGVLAIALVAATLAPTQARQVGEAAPSVTGTPWVNSDPLTIEGLRGRVVLVEFWTYG
jgi:hypothetical protein